MNEEKKIESKITSRLKLNKTSTEKNINPKILEVITAKKTLSKFPLPKRTFDNTSFKMKKNDAVPKIITLLFSWLTK